MTKNNKSSTANKTVSKELKKAPSKAANYDSNDYFFSWRDMPISEARINKIAEELIEWPNLNPDAKSITKFYMDKKISPGTWYKWVDKHPALREAENIALHIIGERLWGKAVEKQYDWKAVHWRLHRHGKEFREDYEYHKKISGEEEPTGTKYIVIEPVRAKEKSNE